MVDDDYDDDEALLESVDPSDRNDLMSMTSGTGVAHFSLDGANQTKQSD